MANKKQAYKTLITLRNDIYQTNPLIQSQKQFDLMGMRIFLLGLRGINPHISTRDKKFDEEFKEIFIPDKQLIEIFKNHYYLHDLEKACEKLFTSYIKLDYENGGFSLVHIFETLTYVPGDGLRFKFDNKMRPYLLDLFDSKGFTKISFEQIFYLSSPYAIRLLEVILQYQNMPGMKEKCEITRSLTLEKLRFILNVPDGAYEGQIGNFRKFVLNAPIKEINAKTDYRMSYKVIKNGRNVTGFEFRLDTSNISGDWLNNDKVNNSQNADEALKKLKNLGFGEKAAKNILDKCDNASDCIARTDYAIQALERQKKKSSVKSETGFLRKAIEENWLSRNPSEENLVEKISRRKENAEPTLLEGILGEKSKSKAEKPEPIEEPHEKGDTRSEEELRRDAEKTGVNFDDFRDDEKPVYPSLLEILKKNFLENPNSPTADVFLKKFNMTSERFKELYM